MGLIYTGVGAVALAVGFAGLKGIFFALEVMVAAMGVGVMQYVLAAPLILVVSYLLGYGIYENRQKGHR